MVKQRQLFPSSTFQPWNPLPQVSNQYFSLRVWNLTCPNSLIPQTEKTAANIYVQLGYNLPCKIQEQDLLVTNWRSKCSAAVTCTIRGKVGQRMYFLNHFPVANCCVQWKDTLEWSTFHWAAADELHLRCRHTLHTHFFKVHFKQILCLVQLWIEYSYRIPRVPQVDECSTKAELQRVLRFMYQKRNMQCPLEGLCQTEIRVLGVCKPEATCCALTS